MHRDRQRRKRRNDRPTISPKRRIAWRSGRAKSPRRQRTRSTSSRQKALHPRSPLPLNQLFPSGLIEALRSGYSRSLCWKTVEPARCGFRREQVEDEPPAAERGDTVLLWRLVRFFRNKSRRRHARIHRGGTNHPTTSPTEQAEAWLCVFAEKFCGKFPRLWPRAFTILWRIFLDQVPKIRKCPVCASDRGRASGISGRCGCLAGREHRQKGCPRWRASSGWRGGGMGFCMPLASCLVAAWERRWRVNILCFLFFSRFSL